MVWLISDDAIVKEIEGQRDRPAVIASASYLEHRLGETLKCVLEQHKAVADRVFKGYGPLSSFSAKIDIAYMIGLYLEYIYKALLTIKEIRNEFAHNPRPVTFRTQRIADLCKNLPKPIDQKKFKLSYDEAIELLASKGEDSDWKVQAVSVASSTGRDTSRVRFLNTIKQILLHLFLMEKISRLERNLCDLKVGRSYWPWPAFNKPNQIKVPRETKSP